LLFPYRHLRRLTQHEFRDSAKSRPPKDQTAVPNRRPCGLEPGTIAPSLEGTGLRGEQPAIWVGRGYDEGRLRLGQPRTADRRSLKESSDVASPPH
jgi:hypothetical protein